MGLEEDIKQNRSFDSEYEKLMVNILFTNGWLAEQQAILFKPYDLTGPQYNVLRILKGQHPNSCTVKLIIERMLDRMSNASRIVDRLERKALVERKTCSSDRRAKDVLITNKGVDLLAEIDKSSKLWRKTLGHIPEKEVRKANEVLDAIRKK